MEYVYVWEYRVASGCEAAFERHYGPQGTWVELFRRGDGHVSTTLLRDREDPQRFMTVDRWRSAEAFAAFRRDFADEFEALDRACEALTEQERRLGNFVELA